MSINAYESIFTKNATLAKFTDENPNIALLFKKIISMAVNISSDWRVDAAKLDFQLIGSPDGKMMIIRVMKKV